LAGTLPRRSTVNGGDELSGIMIRQA